MKSRLLSAAVLASLAVLLGVSVSVSQSPSPKPAPQQGQTAGAALSAGGFEKNGPSNANLSWSIPDSSGATKPTVSTPPLSGVGNTRSAFAVTNPQVVPDSNGWKLTYELNPHDVPPGAYSGIFQATVAGKPPATVNVTATVKDPPLYPGGLILIAAVLGLGIKAAVARVATNPERARYNNVLKILYKASGQADDWGPRLAESVSEAGDAIDRHEAAAAKVVLDKLYAGLSVLEQWVVQNRAARLDMVREVNLAAELQGKLTDWETTIGTQQARLAHDISAMWNDDKATPFTNETGSTASLARQLLVALRDTRLTPEQVEGPLSHYRLGDFAGGNTAASALLTPPPHGGARGTGDSPDPLPGERKPSWLDKHAGAAVQIAGLAILVFSGLVTYSTDTTFPGSPWVYVVLGLAAVGSGYKGIEIADYLKAPGQK